MKLADKTVEVHSRGVKSENQFTIQQSAKMFNVLSNSLYSDKIGAVIRELCTNANDAHIAAKNTNPFHVYLPSDTDPNFKVRDFGTGLSQTDMEKLYTTYGASTKNTSNDFVGCLGLGSKSPFAYTKSFTSTSFFNGKQYTYIASIGDDGIPTLNLMHSCDTTEPNGLEISFAVKRYDYSEFSQKAVRVFHYLKQKPTIFGGYGIDFKKDYSNRNILLSGDNWNVCNTNSNNLFPNAYHNVGSNVIAIMGNIAYPVDTTHLIGDVEKEEQAHIAQWNQKAKENATNYKSFLSNINSKNLYLEIEFGIGELDMDISREGLQYTKAVIKTLRAKTQEIYDSLKKEFSDKISTCKTRVEAIQTFNKLRSINDWGVGASWTCPTTQKTYNLSDRADLSYNLSADKALYVFGYYYAARRSRTKIALTTQIYSGTLGTSSWGGGYTESNVEFFYCDIKSLNQAKKILSAYYKQNNCYCYLIVDTKDHTESLVGVDDLINDVGLENFKKVSDYKYLIAQTRKARAKTGSVSSDDLFFLCGDDSNTVALDTNYGHAPYLKTLNEDHLESLEDMEEIVYIPITRYISCEGFVGLNTIHNYYLEMKDILGVSGNIYAIKEKSVEKLKEDYELIDFNTWMIREIKKSAKKLDKYLDYMSIADKIRVSMDNIDDSQWGYGANHSSVGQILYHMISVFGFDYKKYVKNKKIVDHIDYLIMGDFFTNQTDKIRIGACELKLDEYYAHIDSILKVYGLDQISSRSIYSGIQKMKRLMDMQQRTITDEATKIDFASSSTSFAPLDIKTLRQELKSELDKSPAFKYTMRTSNPGSLTEIDNNRDYRNKWFSAVKKDEAFKVAIGGLINS
jgi:hypothetical protein